MTGVTRWLLAGGLLAAAVGAGVYWTRDPAPAPTPVAVAEAPPPEPAAPQIRHPIIAPIVESDPLPALEESDASAFSALVGMDGAGGLAELLLAEHLIPRLVATIDALPRSKLPQRVLPMRPAKGPFLVLVDGEVAELDARNAQRYEPYVRIVQAIDSRSLADWYVRHYPLFQQAYRELGYPQGYFNDRLFEVIDHLLVTPEVPLPIELVKPDAWYEFADPALQARSAGQKSLIRMGPAHTAAVKDKLRELRAALLSQGRPEQAAPPGGG